MSKKKSKAKEEEILKEIAERLKEIKDEESSNDNEIEDKEDLDLDTFGFDQFIQPMHSEDIEAPVLERIAGSQPRPIFVGGIPQTPVAVAGEEKESDEFKYVPGQEGNNEPKYIESDSRISRELTHMDLRKAGREQVGMVPTADQEAFFRRSEPSAQVESPTFERMGKTEQINVGRAGREDLFEDKHKDYKPKTPKSY